MSVIYRGKRTEDGVKVEMVNVTGGKKAVKPLRHVNYHSPDGFEWGYPGSGPADLALSILAHHLGEYWVNGAYLRRMRAGQKAPLCWQFHQDFKNDVIARFYGSAFEITSMDVHNWLMKQEKPEG